ncbi:cytochrome c biogenesis CcdA family protein [Rarobacter incanus]|uniref:Cytochrome c biogenesis protein CcdA n=1 Tax=Rarobacter incanus TaxID=153494 RepID=A0A542SNZ9_9MICO|nr:cytochrome c biogenesis CcdA family protein [Rarobacter incanus]TQK76285.1 cytochrome c biogenesis protein CcdA [Rarobacter incanus]
MEIGFAAAFAGGLLTIVSPCSVMLLPAFFAYAFMGVGQLLSRTGVFYLGLLATLVPMGVLAGSFGAAVQSHRGAVMAVLAALVMVLGAAQVGGITIPGVDTGHAVRGTSIAAVFFLGTIYGLAGVCAGPILGAILAISAAGANALYGGLVLAIFAAGMIVPLLIMAVAWTRVEKVRWLARPRMIRIGGWQNSVTQVVAGLLTIAVGALLLMTDGTAALPSIVGASAQARMESGILSGLAGVPDAVIVAGAAVAASGVLAAIWYMRRRHLSKGVGEVGAVGLQLRHQGLGPQRRPPAAGPDSGD